MGLRENLNVSDLGIELRVGVGLEQFFERRGVGLGLGLGPCHGQGGARVRRIGVRAAP